jgi:hypothetical protein
MDGLKNTTRLPQPANPQHEHVMNAAERLADKFAQPAGRNIASAFESSLALLV